MALILLSPSPEPHVNRPNRRDEKGEGNSRGLRKTQCYSFLDYQKISIDLDFDLVEEKYNLAMNSIS
jgi:hypothetical protein